MPTYINLAKYPQGMLDIIESVCETRQPATIAYNSTKEAKAERFRFYGLIRALGANTHSLAEKASRLSFELTGTDPKAPNVLKIGFPSGTASDDFYAAIAAKLEEDHKGGVL